MDSFKTLTLFFLYLIVFSTCFIRINGMFSDQSLVTITNPMEKTTHLHFYFHDKLGGKNPTATLIARGPNTTAGSFGSTFVMDDPLTEGPEPSSKVVGRAQGIYAVASQHEFGLLMVLNFAFLEGIYNGSTLSILGRNLVLENIREMPIVGGSGVFRYARGYALAKTFSFAPSSGVAIVEYNVTVLHF
ncbi:hypothetical protein K2173_011342 [Erythroxylum novogranatense]|uniref:Dirigent protein n=1 Tax=Erythroxylum novogranatense TaxID=1862640 RepID=A0AAV8S9J7_9ROSI|nr:hypothetical protein K2173_011342 [Erythroxylum novogranatense]